MGSYMHVIERRRDGWAPPMRVIRYVLRRAKAKGFRSNWNYCGVLDSGALCFADLGADLNQADLVAVKVSGEYKFMTEREYLDMRLQ